MRTVMNNAIDWLSIKLNVGAIALAAISGQTWLYFLTGLATVSTIAYNGVRIYKELKNKK